MLPIIFSDKNMNKKFDENGPVSRDKLSNDEDANIVNPLNRIKSEQKINRERSASKPEKG